MKDKLIAIVTYPVFISFYLAFRVFNLERYEKTKMKSLEFSDVNKIFLRIWTGGEYEE